MSGQRLSLTEQERVVADILRLARELESKGDPFLFGQYMHLRERAECLMRIVEAQGMAAS